MLHIVLWKWTDWKNPVRATYSAVHVNAMVKALQANVKVPHRIVCVTDDPTGLACETHPLWSDGADLANATKRNLPSCYRRLKLYDPSTQFQMKIRDGHRIMGIDLDAIIMRDITPMIESTEKFRFMGWACAGAHHPKVFNGSLQMFTAGDLDFIWSKFDPATSPAQTFKKKWLGSDQSWLSMNLVGLAGCDGFTYPTVASYSVDYRKLREISKRTCIMFFNGRRKPWQVETIREDYWVSRYWRP